MEFGPEGGAGGGGEELEGGEAGGGLGGWGSSGVDEGAGLVDEEVDPGAGGREVTTGRAEGLTKRAHLEVDAGLQPEGFGEAVSLGAEDPGGVGFVDQEHGVVFGGELADVGEGGEIAVHAVEGFDEDEAFVAVGGVLLKAVVEVGGVVVFKADEFGTGEFGAVDHAGVDEAVGEDEVVAVDEVGDGAEAGEVAGAV